MIQFSAHSAYFISGLRGGYWYLLETGPLFLSLLKMDPFKLERSAGPLQQNL